MKRVAMLCLGLALGAASVAEAQLTMQMSNGWSFTFAGNVNAFVIYERKRGRRHRPTRWPVGAGSKGFCFRTGLLPAFAVFDAKGKEGETDLGVHFGFSPQIESGGQAARLLRGPDRHAAGVSTRRAAAGARFSSVMSLVSSAGRTS